MHIHRTGLDDVLAGIPELVPVSECAEVDVLICTLGFEDRTTAVLESWYRAGALGHAKLMLIEYPTNEADNAKNRARFLDVADRAGGVTHVRYQRGTFTTSIAEALKEAVPPGSHVLLDVSTMSSYVFFPTFFALLELSVDLSVAYAEAGHYFPLEAEWDEVASSADREGKLFVDAFENAGFQSHGLGEVFSFAPYYEYSFASRPPVLLAIPNFSPVRMNAMVRRAEELHGVRQSTEHWLVGEPASSENQWRMEAVKRTNNLADVNSSCLHQASTLQYKQTIGLLEGLWDDNKHTAAVSIATLGSKMQHMAVALFCRMHKEVCLWLSEPLEFAANRFSEHVGKLWLLEFGSCDALRDTLDSYGGYEWRLPKAEL